MMKGLPIRPLHIFDDQRGRKLKRMICAVDPTFTEKTEQEKGSQ
jgi:hypothetical protein